MARAAWLAVLLGATFGCAPELGECDEAAARRVAYDGLESFDGTPPSGLPAYEGQALMIQGCGYGSFCHGRDDLRIENRRGAPHGLSFDVLLAAADGTVDEARVARLRRARFRVVQEARGILASIDTGAMPPYGGETEDVFLGAPRYVRLTGGETEPLPAPETPEGREILRNWLACGAPVVERAAPRDDGVASVVVPPLPLPPIEPTWPSLYENLLGARGCGRVVCHGGGDERAGFVVSADRAETLRALMAEASGEDCGGAGRLVAPGDPAGSLLLDKLGSAPSCGDPMPLGGIPLRQVELEAVRAWIACGAPEGDEGCPP